MTTTPGLARLLALVCAKAANGSLSDEPIEDEYLTRKALADAAQALDDMAGQIERREQDVQLYVNPKTGRMDI